MFLIATASRSDPHTEVSAGDVPGTQCILYFIYSLLHEDRGLDRLDNFALV